MEIFLQLAIVLITAKLVAELCRRIKISPLIGEIIAGVIVGGSVLGLLHVENIWTLMAEMGIVFMILMIGLETKIEEIIRVGKVAFTIAILGIIIPLAMGYYMGRFYGYDWHTSLFIASILVATSIAIAARVFMDFGKTRSKVSQTTIAAAVIDDIVGLIVLTIVLAVVGVGEGSLTKKFIGIGEFLLIIFPVFWIFIPKVIDKIRKLEGEGAMFVIVLGITFLFAYLAHHTGLATIVGAFLIGMIFARTAVSHDITNNLKPLYYFLAPIFFIYIGVQVNMFELFKALGFAVVFTIIAVISKIVASLIGGALSKLNWKQSLMIGTAMIPRGEVGLIIAVIGKQMNIIDDTIFAAATFMVLITIILVPFMMKMISKKYARQVWEEEENESK